jgi:hypothetical protein
MIENLDTIERAIIISKYSDEQFELLVLRPDYGHRIVEPSFQSSLTWPGHTVEQALEISPTIDSNVVTVVNKRKENVMYNVQKASQGYLPFLRHNSVATLSCTFRSKLTHMQLLTLPPLPIFYIRTNKNEQ